MFLNTALMFSILGVVSGEIVIPVAPFYRVKEQLGVAFNTTVVTPGLLLPLNVPLSEPTLSLPTSINHGSYVVLTIDPNATQPSFLHWLQTNLTANSSSPSNDKTLLTSHTPATDPYIKPQPPRGTGRHRYILLLFQQPTDFTIPAAFAKIVHPQQTTDRSAFNLTTFVNAAGLDAPVAANFFFAENSTVTPSASISGTGEPPSSTVISTSTIVVSFKGTALKTKTSKSVAGLSFISAFTLGFLFL